MRFSMVSEDLLALALLKEFFATGYSLAARK